LVQSNFGGDLVIDGVPIGKLLGAETLVVNFLNSYRVSECENCGAGIPACDGRQECLPHCDQTDGSIMVIIATDAPLSSRQLYRLAKRATLGLARVGSDGGHGSGDYFIAFSTTYRQCIATGSTAAIAFFVRNEAQMNRLFLATADAVEEAILNSIFKAGTMTGRDNRTVPGLPIDRVIHILRQYGKI